MRVVWLLMALGWPGLAMAQEGNATAGQRVFGACRACHLVGEGAKTGTGPALNGLFGRVAGTIPGYTYSEANAGAGFTWDEAVFSEYIRNPTAKIPGTKMVYSGLRGDKAVADLTAYLKQFDAEGKVRE